jgi:predicted NBD/HSP70 family sugar kinase
LAARGITRPVHIANDADAIAAGVAATRGQLNKLTRVWTIGNGIGYGRWPYVEGVWEGGHITVTLDPKEKFCGCGGVGHLEGIMGYRAMRMRFLDLEPEEVFARPARAIALQGVCRSVASRPGRRDRLVHPPRRPGPLLLHRPQCRLSGSAACCAAIWRTW